MIKEHTKVSEGFLNWKKNLETIPFVGVVIFTKYVVQVANISHNKEISKNNSALFSRQDILRIPINIYLLIKLYRLLIVNIKLR